MSNHTETLACNKDNINADKVLHTEQSLLKNMKKYWPLYIMVIPGVIFLLVFRYIPLIGSVIAFQDYNVVKGFFVSNWVGFKHFQALFTYQDLSRVLVNTAVLGFYKTVLIFPVPVVLALLLNEVRALFLKKSIQTALYIPHFLSWVIIAGLTFDFLSLSGMFNNLRLLFGFTEPILIMQDDRYFRLVYILTSIWRDAGWGTIVYLAALSCIDPQLYESAMIDGATKFKQIRYITFPLMLPTVLILFLLSIGNFMELGFEHVYTLLTPMTFSVGDILDTYVFRTGIQQAQYSFTTAVGLFQSLIGFAMVFTFNKLAKRYSEGGLW